MRPGIRNAVARRSPTAGTSILPLLFLLCHKEALPFGPPVHMRLSAEEVMELVEKCGFKFLRQADLGYNYMIQFTVE